MIPTDVTLTPEQLARLIAFLVEEGHPRAALDVASAAADYITARRAAA